MVRTLVTMLCLWVSIAWPVHAETVNIVDLKAEAAFAGRSLRLSDVAEISGPDASVLSEIIVAKAAGKSTGLNITDKSIRAKVTNAFKGAVTYTGAARVHAVPAAVEVSEDSLKKVFVDEVLRISPHRDAGRIEVVDVRVSRLPRVLPADSRTIQAKFSPRDDLLGFTTATLSVGAGPSPEKVMVTGTVRLIAEIPLVRGKVAPGKVIEQGDLVVRPYDISGCPSAYTRPEDCIGKRSRFTLRQGNPILPAQVERKPDVCSGQAVMIRARTETVVVEAHGVAVKDGFLNENIPVRNLSSGRQVVGTIIAPSVVQVEL